MGITTKRLGEMMPKTFLLLALFAVAVTAWDGTGGDVHALSDSAIGESTGGAPTCTCPATPSGANREAQEQCCLEHALHDADSSFSCDSTGCQGVGSTAAEAATGGFCVECDDDYYQNCVKRTTSDASQGGWKEKVQSYGCSKFWRIRHFDDDCTGTDADPDIPTSGAIGLWKGCNNEDSDCGYSGTNGMTDGNAKVANAKANTNKCRVVQKWDNTNSQWVSQRL